MTKHYCDTCGKEASEAAFSSVDIDCMGFFGSEQKNLHLCNACRKAIVNYINKKEWLK